MIKTITGKIGGGKTLYVVNEALAAFARGSHVMGNLHFKTDAVDRYLRKKYKRYFDAEKQFKFHDFESDSEFQKFCVQGTRDNPVMVICDEAHLFYPAHGHSKQDYQLEKLNSFLSQSRKVFIDLYFITQDQSLLYHRIKAQAEHRIHCIDMRKKRVPLLGTLPGAKLRWVEKDTKSDMVQQTGETSLDPAVFACYDSFQMYDSQMRDLQKALPVHNPIDNRLSKISADKMTPLQKIWYWNPFKAQKA